MQVRIRCVCGNIISRHISEGQYPSCIKCKECKTMIHLETSQDALERGTCVPTKSEDRRSKLVSENRENCRI